MKVGIFGSKQDNNLQDGATQPAEQVQPVNTDGVLSQAAPTPQATAPVSAAPTTTDNDAGSYIVTDPMVATPEPPVEQPSNEVQTTASPLPSQSATSTIPVSEPPAEEPSPEIPQVPDVQVQDSGFSETAPEVSAQEEVPQGTADDSSSSVTETPASSVLDDLVTIKQEALAQLSPIVDHLEQSPEDKFNTTMMLLQSTDDKNLIKVAYESAKTITDEKVRARALLDIVNEINYFSQK